MFGKTSPSPPPGNKDMPQPKTFSPAGTGLDTGFAKVAGLAIYGILIMSFLTAILCTANILKAHKDGGQASFVGLGMSMLTVIVSGSIVTIFNWVT
ncbi:hypothetical protein [Embleya sp. NPDC059237]|uniref:hypothetical protein n=1 Tax=Embleya sp. NPDC059237 TaxID=3346784 RepID=UPI0036B2BA27